MWRPIDLIGTIHMEKGWAYGPIPSPRIKAYLRTILWGLIDPIGTIHMEKGWAYGPISSPRIKAYPRTIS